MLTGLALKQHQDDVAAEKLAAKELKSVKAAKKKRDIEEAQELVANKCRLVAIDDTDVVGDDAADMACDGGDEEEIANL